MFSEMIDRCVHLAGRPDAVEDIAMFANETMRDISKRRDWDSESYEEAITIATGATTVWDPAVGRSRFRREYALVDSCGCAVNKVRPSARTHGRTTSYYYSSRGSLVLANVCGPTALIYYYAYEPWLRYFPDNGRPAVFDVATNTWLGATDAQVAEVSNWQLERHLSVVTAGTLARFFASKQDPRQQVQYSSYEQGISHMIRGESSAELLARSY